MVPSTASCPPISPSQTSQLPSQQSTTSTTPSASHPPASSTKRKQSHPDSNYCSISSSSSKKAKTDKETPGTKWKAKAKKQGQMKLSNFFAAGSQGDSTSGPKKNGNGRSRASMSAASTSSPVQAQTPIDVDTPEVAIDDSKIYDYPGDLGTVDAPLPDDDDPDFLLNSASHTATSTSQLSSTSTPSSTPTFTASQSSLTPSSSKSVQQSWSTLFMKVEPPRCHVHNEPTRSFRVNKQGPNRGKEFYICARPVGPGYDAGRDKRRREDIDPQYRCNFFKWASEARSEAIAKGTKI